MLHILRCCGILPELFTTKALQHLRCCGILTGLCKTEAEYLIARHSDTRETFPKFKTLEKVLKKTNQFPKKSTRTFHSEGSAASALLRNLNWTLHPEGSAVYALLRNLNRTFHYRSSGSYYVTLRYLKKVLKDTYQFPDKR